MSETKVMEVGSGNGPRVTDVDIEKAIVSEHYFTAAEGVAGELHSHVSAEHPIVDCRDIPASLNLLTCCVLVMDNGFTVIGHSACASPENFNQEVGRKIAREKAVEQMWPLLGFRLRDKLHSV